LRVAVLRVPVARVVLRAVPAFLRVAVLRVPVERVVPAFLRVAVLRVPVERAVVARLRVAVLRVPVERRDEPEREDDERDEAATDRAASVPAIEPASSSLGVDVSNPLDVDPKSDDELSGVAPDDSPPHDVPATPDSSSERSPVSPQSWVM
jgi:hypothetical protein